MRSLPAHFSGCFARDLFNGCTDGFLNALLESCLTGWQYSWPDGLSGRPLARQPRGMTRGPSVACTCDMPSCPPRTLPHRPQGSGSAVLLFTIPDSMPCRMPSARLNVMLTGWL